MEEVAGFHKHPETGHEIRGHRLDIGDKVMEHDLYDAEGGWKPCKQLAGTHVQHDFHGIIIRPIAHSS